MTPEITIYAEEIKNPNGHPSSYTLCYYTSQPTELHQIKAISTPQELENRYIFIYYKKPNRKTYNYVTTIYSNNLSKRLGEIIKDYKNIPVKGLDTNYKLILAPSYYSNIYILTSCKNTWIFPNKKSITIWALLNSSKKYIESNTRQLCVMALVCDKLLKIPLSDIEIDSIIYEYSGID